MTELLHVVLTSALLKAALTGALTAAGVDYHAFLSWKSARDFASYSWGVASFRWIQGAVTAMVAASGLAALLG